MEPMPPPPLMTAGNPASSNNGVPASSVDLKHPKSFAIEKQRREQMNHAYTVLRSLIPGLTKIDRASVVEGAIRYVRELVRTVNDLRLLVKKKKKRVGRDRCKRTSWMQRKSKDTEVDVRIRDDEVIIKLVQRNKINCLLFVSKVLDELQLHLHHVQGGLAGESSIFLLKSKIYEGSSIDASGIANKVIEVMDDAAAIPHNGG